MTTSTLEFDEYLTIGLSSQAHEYARAFAAEQQSVTKGKQVYLNTLAVYAVHTYLKSVRISTDLESSHSWDSIKRAMYDHADLCLPGIGRVECCPVLPEEGQILPPVLSRDSVAYVAVQFHNELTQVELRGYYPCLESIMGTVEPIETKQLFALEDFTDFLFWIYDAVEFIETHPDHPTVQELQALVDAGHSVTSIVTRLSKFRDDPSEAVYAAREIFPNLERGESVSETEVALIQKKGESVKMLEDFATEEALGDLAESLVELFNELWEE